LRNILVHWDVPACKLGVLFVQLSVSPEEESKTSSGSHEEDDDDNDQDDHSVGLDGHRSRARHAVWTRELNSSAAQMLERVKSGQLSVLTIRIVDVKVFFSALEARESTSHRQVDGAVSVDRRSVEARLKDWTFHIDVRIAFQSQAGSALETSPESEWELEALGIFK